MQPDTKSNVDLAGAQTLADFIYAQFPATAPIEVQNILPKPYYFKYCTDEDIIAPDQFSKKVRERKYEEKTVEPGESITLLGGAAYIFVDGVARAYVQQKFGDAATGDLEKLAQAAKLAIIGQVNLNNRQALPNAPAIPQGGQAPSDHNPNSVKDDQGQLPAQTGADNTQDEVPFADDDTDGNDSDGSDRFNVVTADESDDGQAHFYVDGKEVTNQEYNEAVNAAGQPSWYPSRSSN